jgi:hypothetical protein
MKSVRGVHSVFREESLKISNNQAILPHIVIVECVLHSKPVKTQKNTCRIKTCNSPGKKVHFFTGYCYNII